ncbi:MAG: prepilin-type N-terminal cleavage/methylation domain-containing protein [Desulfovibrio sp.]|nr:prepilin-type N-terminal cleavage/methylation domain-containing protein [Desulfovibrio sp.]MCA1987218.1 prepilin-type N-terminal cleavage/methylation domain-containing protein [Desulfovibrio sp.]
MLSIRYGRRTSQSGFTLMELLVVLVILGFLLGMVLPRLGSIADNAVDTVCDSNNKGIRYFTKLYLDEKGRYPNDLINLVDLTDTNNEMSVSDLTTDGKGMLHPDFATRNGYTVRALDATEAAELKKWGISKVRNYVGTGGQKLERVSIDDAGVLVASVGALATTRAGAVTAMNTAKGNPYWYGRIMLGVGETSSLITEGYVQAAALCPGGIQNADVVEYNNYVLVLPRLESTVALLGAAAVDSAGDVVEYTLTEDGAASGTARVETITLEAQEKWNFDMSCPEGHKWPDNDNDEWTVS